LDALLLNSKAGIACGLVRF